MGFLTTGKRHHSQLYSSNHIQNKRFLRQVAHSKAQQHQHRHNILKLTTSSSTTTTTTVKKSLSHKSILERLPVELVYEIYVRSSLSKLNFTNRYFHRVLTLHNNQYLIQKLVHYNIFVDHKRNKKVLNLKILNLNCLCLNDLNGFDIDYMDHIDELTHTFKSSSSSSTTTTNDDNDNDNEAIPEYDMPERFYHPRTEEEFIIIKYLLERNLNFLNINTLLENLIRSKSPLKKKNLRIVMQKHTQIDDIRPLLTAITLGNERMAKWLMKYYDHELLESNKEFWKELLNTHSAELLNFFCLSYKFNPQPFM